MSLPTFTDDADGLILASDVGAAFGEGVRLRRLEERGKLHRVARGQYFEAEAWAKLSEDEQYAAKVRGAARARGGAVVVSHQSAAVLWGLPLLAPWPNEVHFTIDRTSGGRSDPGIRKHATGIDARDVVTLDGLLVTSPARTAVDIAASVDLKSAVSAVDRALLVDPFDRVPPLTTRDELHSVLEHALPFRGSVRARAVLAFGTHLSGSPAESGSRVNIALNGFPEPALQRRFVIDGEVYYTDFYWPDENAIGECDGKNKYSDPRFLNGRTVAQAHYDEKIREDHLRRLVTGFTRWDFPTGMSQPRLRRRLLELGLPTGRPRLSRG